jgi:hypothetical protein
VCQLKQGRGRGMVDVDRISLDDKIVITPDIESKIFHDMPQTLSNIAEIIPKLNLILPIIKV